MNLSDIDVFWVLICACLVWIMQAGFLCLETGLTRSKNNINVALKNIVDNATSIFIFWLLGFSIAFGTPLTDFFNLETNYYFFFSTDNTVNAFFVFQAVFCSTCCTIVSGAAAERLKFIMYPVIVLLIGGIIYPFAVHSIWSGGIYGNELGWLARQGFYDFAGATVVHSTGGWIALALILVIGPRLGKFDTAGKPINIQGSNLTLSSLGVLILWFGWLGFNGGSAYSFNSDIGIILSNTLIGGSTSLVATLLICHCKNGNPAPEDLINGALGGLVAVTGAANIITSQEAALIGGINSIIVCGASRVLLKFQIDDVVGAIPVHLAAGIWGTLAVGIFGNLEMLDTGHNRLEQITAQLLGIACIAVWAFGFSYILISTINKFISFRVSKEDELIGLNISEHHATSELYELIAYMKSQTDSGGLQSTAPVDSFTEMGVIGIAYNHLMDKLRENENKIIQSNNELRSANEELKTYDYAVAHDLKNPISVIRSYISLIEEENPDQLTTHKYLDRIRNSANDAMQIIKELLHFANSNESISGSELADLNQVTNNCVSMLEHEINAKNVLLNRQYDLVHIRISKFVLQQILSNLISNSIKYCPPERQPIIEIISYQTSNADYIDIKDNGVGIAKHKIAHIFDLHSRLHKQTLTAKGDGIGLFNVKNLVEKSGGNITVTSQENVGTHIKIEFIRHVEIENPYENSIIS